MKKNIIIIAGAMLLLCACESKQEKLYSEIKAMPTVELVEKYISEYGDSEHADSVRNYYKPLAQRVAQLDTTNYKQLIALADSVAPCELKQWALMHAEKVMLAAIRQEKGNSEMWETYVEHFPDGEGAFLAKALRTQLAQDEAKEAATAEDFKKRLDSIEQELNASKMSVDQADLRSAWVIAQACLRSVGDQLDAIEGKVGSMPPELQQRFKKLKARYHSYDAKTRRIGTGW